MIFSDPLTQNIFSNIFSDPFDTGVIPVFNFLLLEDSSSLLLEDGSKIII